MTVVLGFLIERVAYKPLRTAPRMSVMISAIGVSYFLQNTATYITGGQPMTYPEISWLYEDRYHRRYAHEAASCIITPVLVILLVLGLTQLINHTKVGMAMRAVSRDFETGPAHGHQDQLRHLRDVRHRLGAGGDRLDAVLHLLPRRERPPPVRCPA